MSVANCSIGGYMSSRETAAPVGTELPAVPMTMEGYSVLHQMMRVRWAAWNKLPEAERAAIAKEAAGALAKMEESGETALYSMLGHKGDLMLIHFRNSFDELNAAELELKRLRLEEYVEPTTSYVSVIELGLYDSSVKLYQQLRDSGVVPHSEAWNKAVEETIERQRQAMRPRLYPKIPDHRYACFYPMDRKRGEAINFYTLPITERQRQMEEHGTVGRRYAGKVQQIISGSIGFDDWEWGVDLFAADPLQFKKLIYEMRFDEVSAVYAGFGSFFVGLRVSAGKLGEVLNGKLPDFR
jgi:hydrogen peroxide-dependent heme synthase